MSKAKKMFFFLGDTFVNLQVEVEDQPSLAKSEGVGILPAFKIYKNGSKTKDIPGSNHDILESTIQLYIS